MNEVAGPGLLDLIRVAGAVVLVVGLVAGCGVILRRGGRTGSTRKLRVEERLVVAKGAQLVVVADGPRRLLVGVSDKGINLVSELDEVVATAGEITTDHSESRPFAERLKRAIAERMTVRGQQA